jgi:SsrA-binding protein
MSTDTSVASNKKAFFDYDIQEKLEVGIVLAGSEVKSIRQGHVVIRDSFVRIVKGELWLMNCVIQAYKQQSSHLEIATDRNRKLLAKKSDILKWAGRVDTKNYVVVPLSMYFKGPLLKLQIGLGVSRKKFDKRDAIKDRMVKRDLDRAKKRYG